MARTDRPATPAGVVYGIRHGKPVLLTREDGRWTVRVQDPTSPYAEVCGYVTLGTGYRTARDAARLFRVTSRALHLTAGR